MTRRITAILCAGAAAAAPVLRAQCPDGSPPPCRRAAAAPAPPAASIAVLSFSIASRDSADAFLASGLADAVTARLSAVRRLSVASRTSVERLRGIESLRTAEVGRVLGVAYLLSGTVRPGGGRLVVTAELVRAQTGQQVWSRQFDQARLELLAVQASIAQEAATTILGGLRPEEREALAVRPTRDPRAFELFLSTGLALWDADTRAVQRSIASLEQALRIDPGFSDALGRLAYVYGWAANWTLSIPGLAPESLVARGLALADRALAADSTSVDAWNGRGFLLFFRQPPDYEGSLAATRRAVALDSANANVRHNYATILRRLGDFGSSEEQYHLALVADPRLSQAIADLGFLAFTLRRYREARMYYDSAIAVRDVWQHESYAARMRLVTGDTAAARTAAARMLELTPLPLRSLALAVQAQVDARTGDTAAARAALEPLLASLDPGATVNVREALEFSLALIALGDRDRAIGLLERVRPRNAWLWSYLVMPWYDPVRGDPRFQRLVREAAPPGAPRM